VPVLAPVARVADQDEAPREDRAGQAGIDGRLALGRVSEVHQVRPDLMHQPRLKSGRGGCFRTCSTTTLCGALGGHAGLTRS
jgi:hypothetical protein